MGEDIYKIIFDIYATQATIAENYAKQLESDVRVVAAIGALIYIFGSLSVQIYQNQEINFLPLLRPFVIIMLLPFAPKFCTAIDNFGEKIRSNISNDNVNIAGKVQETSDKIQKKIDEKWRAIGTDPEKYDAVFGDGAYKKDEGGFSGGLYMDFKLGFNRISEDMKFQMISLLQDILLTLMYVAESCLLLVSVGFRVVLRIGFPIALALCMFPGFTGALSNWFGKYLNFALLPAVASMVSSLSFNIVKKYIDNYDVESAMSSMGVETAQPSVLGMGFIAILVLSLVLYLFVPSMTAMLVSVGGVGQLVQGTVRQLGNAGKTGAAVGKAGGKAAYEMGNAGFKGAKAGYEMGKAGVQEGKTALQYAKHIQSMRKINNS